MMTHELTDARPHRDYDTHSHYGALGYLINVSDAGALLRDCTDILRSFWCGYSELDKQVFRYGGVNTVSPMQTSTVCPGLDVRTSFHDGLKLFGVVEKHPACRHPGVVVGQFAQNGLFRNQLQVAPILLRCSR